MNIDKEFQPHIMKDAKAKIGSDGLIGNKIVLIYGGTAEAGPILGSDYLISETGIPTDEMLSTLQKNNKNLLEITENIKGISKKINDGKGSVGSLINDGKIAEDLHSTLLHFKTASANSEKIISQISDFTSNLNKQGTLINQLVTDTLMYTNLQKTISQLREASASISVFSENIKQSAQSLNKTDNTAGLILNDPQMAADIKTITKNLNTSSEKLDQDLRALQQNIFFRGYFRKLGKKKLNNQDSIPK
ncbi:MAG: MCE family protein [Bacteroidetes bacterium]|nr:MCE family protein [Bacteroidota bacterium]